MKKRNFALLGVLILTFLSLNCVAATKQGNHQPVVKQTQEWTLPLGNVTLSPQMSDNEVTSHIIAFPGSEAEVALYTSFSGQTNSNYTCLSQQGIGRQLGSLTNNVLNGTSVMATQSYPRGSTMILKLPSMNSLGVNSVYDSAIERGLIAVFKLPMISSVKNNAKEVAGACANWKEQKQRSAPQ